MLKRTAPELIDAVGEQAALVKRAHLATLVRVAGGLRMKVGCRVSENARLWALTVLNFVKKSRI